MCIRDRSSAGRAPARSDGFGSADAPEPPQWSISPRDAAQQVLRVHEPIAPRVDRRVRRVAGAPGLALAEQRWGAVRPDDVVAGSPGKALDHDDPAPGLADNHDRAPARPAGRGGPRWSARAW